jgi:hypothetical protein
MEIDNPPLPYPPLEKGGWGDLKVIFFALLIFSQFS